VHLGVEDARVDSEEFEALYYLLFTTCSLLLLYCCFTAACLGVEDARVDSEEYEVAEMLVVHHLRYCCFTAALLLLYCCFTAALLLLYC
jgi:hypothetical protein